MYVLLITVIIIHNNYYCYTYVCTINYYHNIVTITIIIKIIIIYCYSTVGLILL